MFKELEVPEKSLQIAAVAFFESDVDEVIDGNIEAANDCINCVAAAVDDDDDKLDADEVETLFAVVVLVVILVVVVVVVQLEIVVVFAVDEVDSLPILL